MDAREVKETNAASTQLATGTSLLRYVLIEGGGSSNAVLSFRDGSEADSPVKFTMRGNQANLILMCNVHFEKGMLLTIAGTTPPYVLVGLN